MVRRGFSSDRSGGMLAPFRAKCVFLAIPGYALMTLRAAESPKCSGFPNGRNQGASPHPFHGVHLNPDTLVTPGVQ
jgi:hypothetical protein